jgi:uncharacterized protein YecT (DUF1311 family)
MLMLCLLPSPCAFAAFGRLPLDMVVSQSTAVVDATILSAKSAGYMYRNTSGICGYVYEARITESFKGGLSGTVVFAADEAIAPQSRRLLFLYSHDGDFPRDSDISIEDPDDPDFDTRMREARRTCLADLPRLKATYLHGARFVPSWNLRNWFVAISDWLRPPPDLQTIDLQVREAELGGVPWRPDSFPQTAAQQSAPRVGEFLSDRRFVPWEALSAWLRLVTPDLVDSSRPDIDCDDGCIRGELAAATAVMDRNLDGARRWRASEPAVVAALDASQKAWETYLRTACRSASIIWREHRVAASLALECPLGFIQARARELWVLRSAAECSYELDDCDDATLAREVDGVAESVRHTLDVFRNDLGGRREVLAAMDADQLSWDAYLQANCRAVALAWHESTTTGPRLRSCWLRLADRRHGEMYWLYARGVKAVARRLGVMADNGATTQAALASTTSDSEYH